MANIAGYIANLGKSVAYSAVDKVKQMTPATTEFAETNAELFKNVYKNVKDYRNTYIRTMDVFKRSKVYEAGEQLKTSLIEDISRGTFYNKKRQDEIDTKVVMGSTDDEDSDWGSLGSMSFDISDDDWGDFSEDEGVTNGDKVVATSIVNSNIRMTNAVSTAMAKTGEYVVESNKATTNILYAQNLKGFNMIGGGLESINKNISDMLNFATNTMGTHADNSTKYFEESTKLLQDQTALLRQIAEAVAPSKKEIKNNKEKTSVSDIIGVNGSVDLKSYAKNIKNNISSQLGPAGSMIDMFGEDSNALLSFVASPLQFIPNYIVNKLTPKTIEKSMKNLDQSINGFFSSLVSKFNSMAKDDEGSMMSQIVGKIFGVRNSVKRDIDSSKYNKNDLKWNGKAQKALTEVLPTQLSKIISILSGKSEQLYDYDKGKFIDSNSLKEDFSNIRKRNVNNASSDMMEYMNKFIQYIKFDSLKEKEQMMKDVYSIFEQMYSNGEVFEVNSKDSSRYTKYNVDSKNYEMFKAMFKSAPRHVQQGINKNILETRERENNEMKRLEEEGSIFSQLFNNSNLGEFIKQNKYDKKKTESANNVMVSNNILKVKDNLDHNIFWYLQNMYKELVYSRTYGINLRGGLLSGGDTQEIPDISAIQLNPKDKKSDISKIREKENRDNDRFLSDQKKRLDKSEFGFVDFAADEKSFKKSIKNIDDLNTIKENLKDKKDNPGFIDKLINSSLTGKGKLFAEKFDEIANKPFKFATNIIDRVDKRLYEVIYGTEDQDSENGFLPNLVFQIKDTFSNLNNWINDELLQPIKDKLNIESFKDLGKKFLGIFGIDPDSIKNYLFGDKDKDEKGLLGDIKDGIKSVFSDAYNTVKESVKEAYSPLVNWGREKFKSKKKQKPQQTLEEILEGLENKEDENVETISQENQSITAKEVVEALTGISGDKKKKEAQKKIKQFKLGSSARKIMSMNKTALPVGFKASSANKVSTGIGANPLGLVEDIRNHIMDIKQALYYMVSRKYNKGKNKLSNIDLDTELSMHPEKEAYTSFSEKLSKNIANFMFGETAHYAEGTGAKAVPETQIASLSKGEVVLSVDDKNTFIEALNNLLNIMQSSLPMSMAEKDINKSYSMLKNKYPEMLSGQFGDANRKQYGKMLKSSSPENLKKVIESVKDSEIDYGEKDHRGLPVDPKMREMYLENQGLGIQMGEEFISGITTVKDALFGISDKKEKEKFGIAMDDIMGNISKYAPTAIGSGLLGAGVSLLTGAIGGPLLGAAVGAGVSITKNSEKVQNWLFGDIDEEGSRKGGVVSKKFMSTIERYLPDFKTYGLAGMATGLVPLVPFGPVGGLMIGSAIAFGKNNEGVQKSLFGEQGLFKEETKKKLEKALPKMGVGAAIGAFAGPFGLVGNIMLGGAIGFASSTEKFQKAILGTKNEETGEYENGLLPSIRKVTVDPLKKFMTTLKDKVFDFIDKKMLEPLRSAFDPLKKQVSLLVKGMFDKVGGALNNIFTSTLGIPMNKFLEDKIFKPMNSIVTRLFKIAMGPIKMGVAAPFKAIGAVGKHYRKKHIRQGNATYMSATERVEFRKNNRMGFKKDKFKNLDKFMSGLDDSQLDEMTNELDQFVNFKGNSIKEKDDIIKEMGGEITQKFNYKKSKQILKQIIKKKNPEYAKILIKESNLSEDEKKELVAYVDNMSSKLYSTTSKIDNISQSREELMNRLGSKDKAFKGMDDAKASKYLKYFTSEKDLRKKLEENMTPEQKEEKEKKEQKAVSEKRFNKIVDLFQGTNLLLDKIANPEKHGHIVVDEVGNVIKMKPSQNGLEPDTTDKSTRAGLKHAQEDEKEEDENTKNTGIIAKFFSKFKKDDGDEEGKEKKKGIFEKLKGGLGSIGEFLTGGKGIKGLLGKGLKLGAGMFFASKGIDLLNSKVIPILSESWESKIKPWLNDTLTPFITDKVIPVFVNGGKWIFEKGLPTVVDLLEKAMPTITKGLNTLLPYVVDGIVTLIPKVGKLIGTALGWAIKDLLPTLIQNSGRITGALFEGVKEIGNSAWNFFTGKNNTGYNIQTPTNSKTTISNPTTTNINTTSMKQTTKDSSKKSSWSLFGGNKDKQQNPSYNYSITPEEMAQMGNTEAATSLNGYDMNQEDLNFQQEVYSNPEVYNNYVGFGQTEPVYGDQNTMIENSTTQNIIPQQPTTPLETAHQPLIINDPNTGELIQFTGYDEQGNAMFSNGAIMPITGNSVSTEGANFLKEGISAYGRHIITGGKTSTKFLPKFAKGSVKKGAKGVLKNTGSGLWKGVKGAGQSIIPGGFGMFHGVKNMIGGTKDLTKAAYGTTKLMNTGVGNLAEKSAKQLSKIDNLIPVGKGKTLANVQQNIAEKLTKKTKDAALGAGMKSTLNLEKNVLSKTVESIQRNLQKVLNSKFVVKLLGNKGPELAEKLTKNIGELISKQILKSGSKMATRIAALASSGGLLSIAFAVGDFISGYNNAEDILGILEASTFQKVVAGLVKVLNNIFVVTSFIPERMWVDLIYNTVLPFFGKTDSSLQKQREEDNKTVEKHNLEHGTDYSIQEYNKAIKEEKPKKGFFEKLKENFKAKTSYTPTSTTSSSKNKSTSVYVHKTGGKNRGGQYIPPTAKIEMLGKGGQPEKKKTPKWKQVVPGIGLGMGGSSSISDGVSGADGTQLNSSNIRHAKLTNLGGSVTASELNKWIVSSGTARGGKMEGQGAAFIEAGKIAGLDPRYVAAHAAWESGWGKSQIVQDKNNFFGIAAYNSSPYSSAHGFSTPRAGIIEGAKWISENYTKAGQDTLHKMIHTKGHRYAVNDDGSPNESWIQGMSSILSNTPGIGRGTLDNSNGSYTPGASSSGDESTEEKKPGIFSLFGDLSDAFSKGLNRLYGFENEDESSSGSFGDEGEGDISGLNSSSSKMADDWFTKKLNATVSSPYTESRINPITGQGTEKHTGIDYAASAGTKIPSPIAGSVEFNQYEGGGFGNYLVIKDKNNKRHYFGHMQSRSPLSVGSKVKVGDTVGYVGTTGRSTGNHLHYEVRNASNESQRYDPNKYLPTVYGNGITVDQSESTKKNRWSSSASSGVGGKGLLIPRNDMEERQLIRSGKAVTDGSTGEVLGSDTKSKAKGGSDTSQLEMLLKTAIQILTQIASNTANSSEIISTILDKSGIKVDEKTKKALANSKDSKQAVVNIIKQNMDKGTGGTVESEFLLDILNGLATE